MPSTTRGSILISTANDIGSTLVDKLGGDGYAPEEWDSAANLCGIASADIVTALSNIQESTPGGADRGSISIAKANSIGRILNKKFDTSRGFKPSEWASAIDKLTPLEIKTASGPIANFPDGADDVPMSSVVAHIAPNLTGTNAVNMVQSGKNLIKPDKYQTAGNNLALGQTDGTSFGTFLKAGTYTISYETTGETCYIYRREENDASNTNMGKKLSTNFTLESDGNFRFWLYGDGAVSANISNVQIEVGSTATTYVPYSAPTTYTANLGRTVYGADADLVSGQGSETYPTIKISDLTFVKVADCQHTFTCTNLPRKYGNGVYNIFSSAFATYTSGHSTGSNIASLETGHDNTIFINGGSARFYITTDSSYDDKTATDFVNDYGNTELIYEASTPETFTFDGQEIPSLLGVNNLWHDDGETEVVYRADIDLAQ